MRIGTILVLAAFTLTFVGCNQKAAEKQEPAPKTNETAGHNHNGWWCTEHGIPEEQCSMCSSSAANECKEKGDWCEKHNRAASQCFICDPTRAEKFTKLYEAKFGEKPPKSQ